MTSTEGKKIDFEAALKGRAPQVKEFGLPAREILVQDLRIGDKVGTVMTVSRQTGETLIVKYAKVTDIDECPSAWRTHVHVNRKDCHDTRQYVWIVA